MRINNIKLTDEDGCTVLSGMCRDFELFFKFHGSIKPQLRGDAFIVACLVPAMVLGLDIELDDSVPVSPALLRNLDRLQDMFCQWCAYFHRDLRRVKINGGRPDEAVGGLDKDIAFFSGGVDGNYTLLRHLDEINLLFFVKGIDMQLSSDRLFDEALSRNRRFIESKNKELLVVETNVRFLGFAIADAGWTLCFGGGLASIALAANVRKCFLASGLSYSNLYPEGSNFITDHLWSNEHTKIIHDGAEANRIEKLAVITRDPAVQKILRVCWQDKGYNCGQCEKCLRTMIAIRALQITVPTFPQLTDDLVKKLPDQIKLYKPIDYDFLMQNLEQAERVGDRLLIKVLTRIKKRYEIKELLRQFDKTLFSGRLAKWKAGNGEPDGEQVSYRVSKTQGE